MVDDPVLGPGELFGWEDVLQRRGQETFERQTWLYLMPCNHPDLPIVLVNEDTGWVAWLANEDGRVLMRANGRTGRLALQVLNEMLGGEEV